MGLNEFCSEEEDLESDESALGLLIFVNKRGSCEFDDAKAGLK